MFIKFLINITLFPGKHQELGQGETQDRLRKGEEFNNRESGNSIVCLNHSISVEWEYV